MQQQTHKNTLKCHRLRVYAALRCIEADSVYIYEEIPWWDLVSGRKELWGAHRVYTTAFT